MSRDIHEVTEGATGRFWWEGGRRMSIALRDSKEANVAGSWGVRVGGREQSRSVVWDPVLLGDDSAE